jgi:hypothetical protein
VRSALLLAVILASCRFSPENVLEEGGEADAPGTLPDSPGRPADPDAAGAIDGPDPADAPPPDAPPPPDAAVVACVDGAAPPGYSLSLPGRSSCYRVDFDIEWWIDAQTDCDDDGSGSHLVVIDDLTENGFLRSIKPPGGNIWVGVSDRVDEGSYRWVTDQASTISPLPWHPRKGGASDEDCVELRDADALWNDHDCVYAFNSSYRRAYVCEYDGIASNPSNY